MARCYLPDAEFAGGDTVFQAGGSAAIGAAAAFSPAGFFGDAFFCGGLDAFEIVVADSGGVCFSCRAGCNSCDADAAFEADFERAGGAYVS